MKKDCRVTVSIATVGMQVCQVERPWLPIVSADMWRLYLGDTAGTKFPPSQRSGFAWFSERGEMGSENLLDRVLWWCPRRCGV